MRKRFNNSDYIDMGESASMLEVTRSTLLNRIKKWNVTHDKKEQIVRKKDGLHIYMQFKFIEKLAEPTTLVEEIAEVAASTSGKKEG